MRPSLLSLLKKHHMAQSARSKLDGAQVFRVLDCSTGYWQVQLDDDSSKLCTYNTPFGRYRFLRMPYGISSASDVFQQKIKAPYEGIDGVEGYIDEMIVYGRNKKHNERLFKVF